MSNIKNIEAAIKELSESELRKFRSWFAKYDAKNWDVQIEQDAFSGKLDALAREAMSQYESDKATEF